MKTKHTAGQWTVNDKNEVEVKNIMGKVLTRFTPFTPKSKIDNSEANAKLIASAPDLLHSLQMLINDIERNDGDAINRATLVNEAKQVIDKATS
jgi:hypothetical protein